LSVADGTTRFDIHHIICHTQDITIISL
jgi:hypothetical protein